MLVRRYACKNKNKNNSRGEYFFYIASHKVVLFLAFAFYTTAYTIRTHPFRFLCYIAVRYASLVMKTRGT